MAFCVASLVVFHKIQTVRCMGYLHAQTPTLTSTHVRTHIYTPSHTTTHSPPPPVVAAALVRPRSRTTVSRLSFVPIPQWRGIPQQQPQPRTWLGRTRAFTQTRTCTYTHVHMHLLPSSRTFSHAPSTHNPRVHTKCFQTMTCRQLVLFLSLHRPSEILVQWAESVHI